MIKILNSDDNKNEKNLKKTKYILVILKNGSAVSTFATEKTIKSIKKEFKDKSEKLLNIKGYDAEYHEDGDMDILQAEIIFWANEMSSIKVLELNDAPFVEE